MTDSHGIADQTDQNVQSEYKLYLAFVVGADIVVGHHHRAKTR